MRGLSVSDIIILHQKVIDKTGGSHGIRDIGLIESAVSRAYATFGGNDLYESVEAKIAATAYSLVGNHGFVDGNKRIGIAAMLLLLQLNGYKMQYSQQELIDLGMGLAAGNLDENDIQQWIKAHS
ncbi:type II toxin-antitoxin system death-on-curing family toxin [Sporomusa sphaeroides]|uniref:type II toxin-antitoxin system death-on-curing family toxin n=1 Tax=Sporomusa sphaeroides TaxID=47679 RepID=UPI002BF98E6D|nr:type II toxin-antitoxin system death-on-curing family toxin [Sporomusa sphaeroides]HML33426.1 type II toxin-antitoxin system death-on-curing family toxin [Sporomusa sphaeroides]